MIDPFDGSCSLSFLADLLQLSPGRIQQLARIGVTTRARHGRYALVASVKGYVHYLRLQTLCRRRKPRSLFVRQQKGDLVLYFTSKEQAQAVDRAIREASSGFYSEGEP